MQENNINEPRNKDWAKKVLVIITSALIAITAVPGITAFAAEETESIGVSSGEQLNDALKTAPSGSTIKLMSDIDAISSATYTGKTLTIDGNGYTIDGGGINKTAIRFNGTSDITLKNITIQNCASDLRYGGGGVGVFRGTLKAENASFIGNTSTGTGDGGGVLVDGGGASFTNCTFYGNTSKGNGGALAVAGVSTITNCTIVDNQAATNGGGIYNNASGTSTSTVYNSIIVKNTAPGGADAYKLADGSNNLLGMVASLSSSADSSEYYITAAEADGWLASSPELNGGTIPTIALLEDNSSPAVDSANSAYAPDVDQRGTPRDGAPDIGAYELIKAVGSLTNAAKLSADAKELNNPAMIDFTLATKLAVESKINAIEIIFDYDKETFTAATKILSKEFQVASVSVDQNKGSISVIIGVTGTKTITYADLTALARTSLTKKAGTSPEVAKLSLRSFKIYSEGSPVETAVVSSSGTTKLVYTSGIPMDVNGDGKIDAADLSITLFYFGSALGDSTWPTNKTADINGDSKVDILDVMLIVAALHSAA